MRDDSRDRHRTDDRHGVHESPPRTSPIRSHVASNDPVVTGGTDGRAATASETDPSNARSVSERRTDDPGPDDGTAPGAGGSVHLVGAGPGDPELLTRRAWDRLRTADAVLHDSLTDRELVEDLPDCVAVVDVGKRSSNPPSQAAINERMLDRATAGQRVVRLKGGDPNVFGRGGEECEFLAEADVPFEVVPGVSSAVAAPGVAGIPLTHRDHASSVTVLTGHEDPTKPESALDYEALANQVLAGGTLVVLMGVRRLPDTVGALRAANVPADTPAAMIQRATWRDQQTVTGTLSTIVDRRDDAGIEPPAVTVIGDVVGVRETVEEGLLESCRSR